MAWLLREGEVLATLEVASNRSQRLKGLLGRDGIEGALLLEPGRSVHTLGMHFPIDVAFCSPDLVVIGMVAMSPWRVSLPRRGCRCVIEAPLGAFERWRLACGDQLEVKP